MASNPENGQPQPGQKTLHVWSKPVEEGANPTEAATPSNQRPTISEAVSTIKTEDFANIANTPCARQGLLTGIATGAGVGGLRFVLRGSPATIHHNSCRHANKYRKCDEICKLGSWIFSLGKRGIFRILPISPTSRTIPDEAT